MTREIVSSDRFPSRPINSPAVKVPGLIFCSGQVGLGAEVGPATVSALEKIEAVLELGGSSLDKVVKYNIYLLYMDDFDAMNKAFVEFLPSPKPARTCIQAAKLPSNAIVEVECIATA